MLPGSEVLLAGRGTLAGRLAAGAGTKLSAGGLSYGLNAGAGATLASTLR